MSKNIQKLVMIDFTIPLTFLFFLTYKLQVIIKILSYVKMIIVLTVLFALCLDVALKYQPEKLFTLKLSIKQRKVLMLLDVINMVLLILLVELLKSIKFSVILSVTGLIVSGVQCFIRAKSLKEIGD